MACRDWGDLKQVVVPDGMYFVAGDNRGNSLDSRIFGPVSKSQLHAKVLAQMRLAWAPWRRVHTVFADPPRRGKPDYPDPGGCGLPDRQPGARYYLGIDQGLCGYVPHLLDTGSKVKQGRYVGAQ